MRGDVGWVGTVPWEAAFLTHGHMLGNSRHLHALRAWTINLKCQGEINGVPSLQLEFFVLRWKDENANTQARNLRLIARRMETVA